MNLKESGVCNKIITQLNQKIKERDLKNGQTHIQLYKDASAILFVENNGIPVNIFLLM